MTRIGFAGLILLAFTGAASAGGKWARDKDSWTQMSDVGRNPIVRNTREELPFSPTGRVDVREIGGSVEVTTGKRDTVAFAYEVKGATQQDLDCLKLEYEHDKDRLRIAVKWKKEKQCRVIRTTEKLTLVVPRTAEVSLQNIGDSVQVTGLEGMLRLDSVGDSADLRDIQQLNADSIGDQLKLELSRIGPAGIKVDSVGDKVDLGLPESIDATLKIGSVGDEIRVPDGMRVTSLKSGDAFQTTLGRGGPVIHIDSVGDSVVIRRRQRL